MKRIIEVFTAECSLCDSILREVEKLACSSCEITVVSTRSPEGAARAMEMGVKSVPAIAIDGSLPACCQTKGVSLEALKHLGLGEPQP